MSQKRTIPFHIKLYALLCPNSDDVFSINFILLYLTQPFPSPLCAPPCHSLIPSPFLCFVCLFIFFSVCLREFIYWILLSNSPESVSFLLWKISPPLFLQFWQWPDETVTALCLIYSPDLGLGGCAKCWTSWCLILGNFNFFCIL